MYHLADSSATFGVTICGGCHVFVPRFDPDDCLRTMEQEKVTHAVYVPTMLNMVANHPKAGDFDLSNLKSSPMAVRRCPRVCCARRSRFPELPVHPVLRHDRGGPS